MSTGPACRLHMTHLVGSGGHRGPRALLGHLAPAAHLRASPIGCAQPVTCDLFRLARNGSLRHFCRRRVGFPPFPVWTSTAVGHLQPLLLMTIRSYGLRLHSCTAQGFCTPQPVALRPALGRAGPSQANQTVAVLLVARPTHRRLRPAGGRPPPALTVVRPCPWPMGHDGLSPSCRAKSIVAVMTLWQGYTHAQAAHTCVLA